MPFEFIDNSRPLDHAAKQHIRSHAASGRNKGKKITRLSRKSLPTVTTAAFRIPRIMENIPHPTQNCVGIERPIDDGLVFPVFLRGDTKTFVKKAISFMSAIRYSVELSNGLDYTGLSTPICVQYMFLDEAYFHSAIATASICIGNLVPEPESMLLAMHHISRTFRLVNERLSSRSEINDNTVAVIASMAQYERQQDQYQRGLVHVQCLWRIAQLQGGISQLLKNKPGLEQKVLRLDLEYSLALGSSSLFTLEEARTGCKTGTRFPSLDLRKDNEHFSLRLVGCALGRLPTDLKDLFIDMSFLASQLNDSISHIIPKLNCIDFHKDTLLLGYRLVKLKHIGLLLDRCSFQNRVYLGLMAFLMTFLQGWDHRIPRSALLSEWLLLEIQQPSEPGQDTQEIFLWLLFIGAASSCLWDHPLWLSITKNTTLGLGIESWEDVKKIFVKFPWVNAVHDSMGQKLWFRSNELHLNRIIR